MPIVVVEEILRGRLNAVRQAGSGAVRVSTSQAYDLLQRTLRDFEGRRIVGFSTNAEDQFRQWRQSKVRVATNDLRIAAICVSIRATLVTRNRIDFSRVPGLNVEFWG